MSITNIHFGISVKRQELFIPSPAPAFPLIPSYKSPRGTANEFLIPHPLSTPSYCVGVPLAIRSPPHMQDPKKEIPNVIRTLCTTRDANELQATVEKYFASDAKFSHPLCKANSRNEILGLFQWYRLASPETQIKVLSVSEYLIFESRLAGQLTSYHAQCTTTT